MPLLELALLLESWRGDTRRRREEGGHAVSGDARGLVLAVWHFATSDGVKLLEFLNSHEPRVPRYCWIRGVVVITSALHAEDLEFKPRRIHGKLHFCCFNDLSKLIASLARPFIFFSPDILYNQIL